MRTAFSAVFYGFRVHGPRGMNSNFLDAVELGDEGKALAQRLVELGRLGPEPPLTAEYLEYRRKVDRHEVGQPTDAEHARMWAPQHAWEDEAQKILGGCSLVVSHDHGTLPDDEDHDPNRGRTVFLAIRESIQRLDSEQWSAEAALKLDIDGTWRTRLRDCAELVGFEPGAPGWLHVLW